MFRMDNSSESTQPQDGTSQSNKEGHLHGPQDVLNEADRNGSTEPKLKKKNVFDIDRNKIKTMPGSKSQVGELQVSKHYCL